MPDKESSDAAPSAAPTETKPVPPGPKGNHGWKDTFAEPSSTQKK